MPKDWIEIADMILDAGQLASFIPRLLNMGSSEKDKESAAKAEQSIRDGKPKEAVEEALQTWKLGFGLEDEMRLLRDVAVLIDSKKLKVDKAAEFMNFLKNMTPLNRKRFREAYTTEKDRKLRLMTLLQLAQLETDDKRMTFLNGSGMYDNTSFENFMDALESPLASMANFGKARVKTLEERWANRPANPGSKAKPEPQSYWWVAIKAMFTFGLTKR